MGNTASCVPQSNFRRSFRRRSSRKFWKKDSGDGPEKSNSILNIMGTVTPATEMSKKDIETIQNIKWDPPAFAYDASGGWKKSSINVKNYGRLIHSSKVRFRFLHCQEIHDCYLDLFQTHLHFVSNNTTGLTYQGTLPLKELAICQQPDGSDETNPFAFQIDGIGLNPIVVFCSSREELDTWMAHLREHVEGSGGTVASPETKTYARVKSVRDRIAGREELRNSVKNEPIYEWEGSQRESLGPVVYVTKVQLQHVPCQEQYDRLLVLYPASLIILSEERNGLFYKGKLPLNMITVTTPCQDVRPNTFMIEGKLINPIIVSCLDKKEFHDWIHHFKGSYVPVHIPPPPVYDIIDNPTKRAAAGQFDRFGRTGSGTGGRSLAGSHRLSMTGRGAFEPKYPSRLESPTSAGYTEPLCYLPSRPGSTDTLSSRHGPRSNSFSHRVRPPPNCQGAFQRFSYAVAPADSPASPVYNTPYPAVNAERYFLVKSNSWSTPQSGGRYHPSGPQRHSDMCAPRRPLSPLYDDPSTPGRYLQEDNYVRPAPSMPNPSSQPMPPTFRLCTPPPGRRRQNLPEAERDVGSAEWTSEQRAKAVSRLKLLSPPTTLLPNGVRPVSYSSQSHLRAYNYEREDNAFLEAAEPDDQEIDYDNVWDFDRDGGIFRALPGTSPRWGAGGGLTTQPRW